MEKMTYISVLNDVKNGATLTAEHFQKIDSLIERLKKQNTSSGKPTKAQLANQKLQTEIFDSMALHVDYTIAEMITNFPCLTGMSTQKVAPQMADLVKNGMVVTTKVKGKNIYHKVDIVD